MASWKQLVTTDDFGLLAGDANSVVITMPSIAISLGGTFIPKLVNATGSPSPDNYNSKSYAAVHHQTKEGVSVVPVTRKNNTLTYYKPALTRTIASSLISNPFSSGSSWKIAKVNTDTTMISKSLDMYGQIALQAFNVNIEFLKTNHTGDFTCVQSPSSEEVTTNHANDVAFDYTTITDTGTSADYGAVDIYNAETESFQGSTNKQVSRELLNWNDITLNDNDNIIPIIYRNVPTSNSGFAAYQFVNQNGMDIVNTDINLGLSITLTRVF